MLNPRVAVENREMVAVTQPRIKIVYGGRVCFSVYCYYSDFRRWTRFYGNVTQRSIWVPDRCRASSSAGGETGWNWLIPHIALTKPSELLVIIIIIIPSFTSTIMYNVLNWAYDFYRNVTLILDSFFTVKRWPGFSGFILDHVWH